MAVEAAPDVLEIPTSAGTVRVRDTGGDGPPMLLVHSLLVDGDLYARLVPLLTATGHRCIVPELPLGAHARPLLPEADLSPHGLARLLVEVLDALRLERAHVVGVDTGGALTQLLMAAHRDRVDRVVLTACDAYEEFPPRSFGFLVRPLLLPGVLALAGELARAPVVRGLGSIRPLTHAGVGDAMLKRWVTPLRSAGARRDLRKVLAGMHPSVTLKAAEANRDFPRPVLVAWGDDDRVFPRRLAERLAAELPDARLVTLEDCGAFAALDQPGRLAELITEHVAASPSAPAVAPAAPRTGS